VTYELGVVFSDRHKEFANQGGHLLSVDRRILCLFIHLLDYIGCFALLYLVAAQVGTAPFSSGESPGELNGVIQAVYFSAIVASFTGLSSVTPGSDATRLLVISEIVLNFLLFSIALATVVGSVGGLKEMNPRPPRSPRIFGRRK